MIKYLIVIILVFLFASDTQACVNKTICTGSIDYDTFFSTITSLTVDSPPSIIVGAVTGNITACVGSPSVSPYIQQFSASGEYLTDAIKVSAPAGFEVSITPTGGYANSIILAQSSGTINDTKIYVRAVAATTPGSIIGNVILSSAGLANISVVVQGVINALPTVNGVVDQTKKNNTATDPITFTGTGKTYTWVNDNPSIGLATNGIGNIASFIAKNTSSNPVTANLSVTSVVPGMAYISNVGSNTVSVINTASNTVVSTINVGNSPIAVSVSPDNKRVYVANSGSGSISVIDAVNNTLIKNIGVGSYPYYVIASPDGTHVYALNFNDDNVSVINTTTNTVTGTFPVGDKPLTAVISPDGKLLYVANYEAKTVSIINTLNGSLVNKIDLSTEPWGMAISPDGSRVYVGSAYTSTIGIINTQTYAFERISAGGNDPQGLAVSPDGKLIYTCNSASNSVSVIDAQTKAIVAVIPVGQGVLGISLTPDGGLAYVSCFGSNDTWVINTASNKVVTNVKVGLQPNTIGNFVIGGSACSSVPVAFKIIVNPSIPFLSVGAPIGNISACIGSVSASPNIKQFVVSGDNLSAVVTINAPIGFEISLTPGSDYSNNLTVSPVAGLVDKIVVYVRADAAKSSGKITGNIELASIGAETKTVAVDGVINELPTVNTVSNQLLPAGAVTTTISFTGTGNTYSWTNDNPSVGIAAYGTGDMASFSTKNTTTGLNVAHIIVTPRNDCDGTPISFQITVEAPLVPTLSVSALPSSVNTEYGTPSTPTTFIVSGINLTAQVTITAPQGFEISRDGATFSGTLTIQSTSTLTNQIVYIRLAENTAAGVHSGNIQLTSSGATVVNVAISNSVVSLAPLTISINKVSKNYGDLLTSVTDFTDFIAIGLKNSETIGSVTVTYGSGAAVTDAAGVYSQSATPLTATGGSFNASNYNITYLPNDVVINKIKLTITADNKSRVAGNKNPPLTATYSGFVNNDGVAQLSVLPLIKTSATILSDIGQYPITASGADGVNYTFAYVDGVLTIKNPDLPLVIPNTFTPNDDGINDIWVIKNIELHPTCSVQIFNRYGKRVFNSEGYAVTWDGRYNGDRLPSSVYYYVINLNNGASPLSGSITILR